jgi:hypothetical protein
MFSCAGGRLKNPCFRPRRFRLQLGAFRLGRVRRSVAHKSLVSWPRTWRIGGAQVKEIASFLFLIYLIANLLTMIVRGR